MTLDGARHRMLLAFALSLLISGPMLYLRLQSSEESVLMLDKIKDLGAQVANKASDTVGGIVISVKEGVESLADTASSVNEKAVRTSAAQMCRILEIAVEELKDRPLTARPVSLTATVNFGIGTLEMQVHLGADNKVAGTKT